MDIDLEPMSSDQELIAACAAIIDVPKAGDPNSFVLHAPLELLARALLLERLPEPARGFARERIRELTSRYVDAGPSATAVEPLIAGPDDVILSLAAAGHAPILGNLRSRVAAVPQDFGSRLVSLELRRNRDWRLEWPRARASGGQSSGDLAERLARPPSPGDPGSDFIYPTMHLVDDDGFAAKILEDPLRGMTVSEARRTLLRTAAQSMLQDAPASAPYGWTHCLTLPQAVLAAATSGAEPEIAVAVAATYVLGFRATQGQVQLEPEWQPVAGTAAARVLGASDAELSGIIDEIVIFGAVHPDAHVAKYTLACLDAAAADAPAARLFLAAASRLQEWWRSSGAPPDQLVVRAASEGLIH